VIQIYKTSIKNHIIENSNTFLLNQIKKFEIRIYPINTSQPNGYSLIVPICLTLFLSIAKW